MTHTPDARSKPMQKQVLSRRQTLAIGSMALCSGATVTATAQAANEVSVNDVAGLVALSGQEAILSGRIVHGPHYSSLCNQAGVPMVRLYDMAPDQPRQQGLVRIKGQLQTGTFPHSQDGSTAHALLFKAEYL